MTTIEDGTIEEFYWREVQCDWHRGVHEDDFTITNYLELVKGMILVGAVLKNIGFVSKQITEAGDAFRDVIKDAINDNDNEN